VVRARHTSVARVPCSSCRSASRSGWSTFR
jgi:hypothetical protein